MERLRGAAAADKMYDFQPVAIFQRSCFPPGAGNDFQIELDRDAVPLHAKLLH